MTEIKTTPYQGNMKCYGFFECIKCKNKWTSKHSWANTSQKCKFCLCDVFPHHQLPKEIGFSRKQQSSVVHNKELCGKCQELGVSCTYRVHSTPKGRRRYKKKKNKVNKQLNEEKVK